MYILMAEVSGPWFNPAKLPQFFPHFALSTMLNIPLVYAVPLTRVLFRALVVKWAEWREVCSQKPAMLYTQSND